jgi:hypothetical protein
VSIVTDRRCDGCGEVRPLPDSGWLALTPPGYDGEDHRLDFCDLGCLKAWVKSLKRAKKATEV